MGSIIRSYSQFSGIFNIPVIESASELTFEFKATDNSGQTLSKLASIAILPNINSSNQISEITVKSGANVVIPISASIEVGEAQFEIDTPEELSESSELSITSNYISFKAPLIEGDSLIFNLQLLITDDFNTQVVKKILVKINPADNYFSPAKVIKEFTSSNIYISDYGKHLQVYESDESALYSYNDSALVLSEHQPIKSDVAQSHDSPDSSIDGTVFFADFDKDGTEDLLYVNACTYNFHDDGSYDYGTYGGISIRYGEGDWYSSNINSLLDDPNSTCWQMNTFVKSISELKDINDDEYLDLKYDYTGEGTGSAWFVWEPDSAQFIFSSGNDGHHDDDFDDFYKVYLDFDLDGDTDLLGGGNFYRLKSLKYREKLQDNDYSDWQVISSEGDTFRYLSVADVNRDGHDDVYGYLYRENVDDGILFWLPSSTLDSERKVIEAAFIPQYYDALFSKESRYFFDYDNQYVSIYDFNEQLKTPVITQKISAKLPENAIFRLWFDLDKDGDLDIIAQQENKIILVENLYN
ncbi:MULTISPECIES: VCBS repeat-containing protein [unclassified Pseudoalteromonas]|uniref:FG-GAP repeat domain-containing protein n=1 Tax=unclassified Pseudoalteromonas TaxID=194690 RepID=UPI0005A5F331|nr:MULTISPECIES: VCBS repeat-containing protein [unclassified Pseudoalteromonas]